MKLNNLSKYTRQDTEKRLLIEKAIRSRDIKKNVFYSKGNLESDISTVCDFDYVEDARLKRPPLDLNHEKVCPKCGRKYPADELFCFDCAVRLRDIEDVNIKDIDVCHDFSISGSKTYDDFESILTEENLIALTEFELNAGEFHEIITNIKLTALKNLDAAVRDNGIDIDDLTILEKVMLFTKSFVDVEYKSYGPELGYYSFNKISVDDRQLDALQITTMLHELTHFLIKEILTHVLCRLLDASKTRELESVISFTMSYSAENCLIDEYAAHTVEGRFTLIGYQDYSSFLSIQKTIKRPDEEIEMLKTIANSLANVAKDIIQSFIDDDLLEEIKDEFKKDILDEPNYSQLMLENCTILNAEGFFRAMQFILVDGFAVAMDNLEKLAEINEMW